MRRGEGNDLKEERVLPKGEVQSTACQCQDRDENYGSWCGVVISKSPLHFYAMKIPQQST